MTALKEMYRTEIVPKLQAELGLENVMAVPRISKITLNMGVGEAIGDKKGIVRYGHAYIPLDEALSRVVLDISGRPGLEYAVPFTRASIGGFDTELFYEFFQGFVNHALVTLHIDNLRGDNAHHQAETVFKAFARALRAALEIDPRSVGVIPSTKGSL